MLQVLPTAGMPQAKIKEYYHTSISKSISRQALVFPYQNVTNVFLVSLPILVFLWLSSLS